MTYFDFITAVFDFETFVVKQIKMEAFVASRWIDEWFDTAEKIRDWILEVSWRKHKYTFIYISICKSYAKSIQGRIKVAETVKDGFESLPQAMMDLFSSGKCLGKMIVKA